MEEREIIVINGTLAPVKKMGRESVGSTTKLLTHPPHCPFLPLMVLPVSDLTPVALGASRRQLQAQSGIGSPC